MGGDGSGERMQVIMVPLPSQSHLNSLLHFSRLIAQRGGVSVSFLSTSAHINQVRRRVEGFDHLHNLDIRFQELPMPQFTVEKLDSRSSHMFPFHLIPLFEAVEDQLGPHLDRVLSTICSENKNRVVVVYDAAMGWVQALATKYSIPAYVFRTTGSYFNLWMKRALADHETTDNVLLERCFPARYRNKWKHRRNVFEGAKGYITNTFSALESGFIQQEREESVFGGKPVWTVGPLLPEGFFTDKLQLPLQAERECMRWLDKQAPASVLYVSFGSTSCFSAAQLRELADGLERSGHAFLWVIMIPDGAHSSTESQYDLGCKFVDEGYERRLEGRGFIVRNWAPQLDILLHKSTGGFLSHCGWNSTLESISAGVGILTWPLHSDQFANSALITRELKAGIEVKEWENAEENEEVNAEEIEKGVKRLMGSEEGKGVRKRAQELRGDGERAVGEGGSSWKDLDSLLHHFSQSLCD